MRGALVPEARRVPVETLRICVPETVVFDGCEPEVKANCEAAIERMARAGARIERRPLPRGARTGKSLSHGHFWQMKRG